MGRSRIRTPRPRRTRESPRVTFDTVRRIALALPGVEDSVSYGTRALKVEGKFLARIREDGESLAIKAAFPVREALMQEHPEMFYITDHYLNYPALLVRLSKVDPAKLRHLVEHAWRFVAPKRLVRALDSGQGIQASGARNVESPHHRVHPTTDAPRARSRARERSLRARRADGR